MNLKKIYLVVLAALCLIPNLIWGQLTVNTNLTPQQLVQNVLLGSGITAFNITYTGAPNAIGSFNGANSNIGIGSGVIMTSGDIANAPGPNNLGGAGTPNQTAGDNDLNNLGGGNTFDGCILEFDFIPLSNDIKFNFAFGSEEYNEFVNTSFNDVFAFFLSGPGIVGLKNIALIPNTTLPVSINNINNGNANAGPCMNCTYFTITLVVLLCNMMHLQLYLLHNLLL
ncbi:MAG: choice-of-anchor L domain-containing protein [Bacteroidetes bacterium]|nr:choice-of-anchor L domain-containing protein [Bacteroidota bacterium]